MFERRLGHYIRFANLVHFLLGAVGLIVWAHAAVAVLFQRLRSGQVLPNFYSWSEFFNFPEKPSVIYSFAATSAILFLYSAVWIFVFKKAANENRFEWKDVFSFISSWAGQIAALIFFKGRVSDSNSAWLGYAVLWAALIMLPSLFERLSDSSETSVPTNSFFFRCQRLISVGVIASCLVVLVWMFGPLIFGPLKFLNDQFTVPEQTVLGSGVVQNISYIRQHKIYGLEPSSSETPTPYGIEQRKGFDVRTHESYGLTQWLFEHHHGMMFDRRSGVLTSVQQLAYQEWATLGIVLDTPTGMEDAKNLSLISHRYDSGRPYTSEENEFMLKNSLEVRWQMLNRWAIHHHNFVFGPMNEFRLGKSISEISFQYGFLNTLTLLEMTKIFGGFSLDNYFRSTFLFYPLYFILFLLVGKSILRDQRYLSLLAVLALSSVLFLDCEKIVRAPGLSPIRHFFDLGAICFLAWYWRTRFRPALVMCYLSCLLQVAFNREFGLFLLGAVIASEVVQTIEDGLRSRKAELAFAVLAVFGTGLILLLLRTISNSMNSYYSGGFASPPLPNGVFTGSLFLMAALYGICFWPGFIDKKSRNILLFLSVYSNGLFIYYIWGVSPAHFQNLSSVHALTAVVALQAILTAHLRTRQIVSILTLAQLGAVLLLLVPGIFVFQSAKAEVDKVFTTHVVHQWDFPLVHLQTTADPAPFKEAVDLIHRYEPSSNGVYFVSVLDNYLTVLSDRYSLMPYFDLAWFLLTPTEFETAKTKVLEAKPKHLFVDHDILFDRSGEVADIKGPGIDESSHFESLLRIKRLEVFTRFFKSISANYIKVAESPLIDVYELK